DVPAVVADDRVFRVGVARPAARGGHAHQPGGARLPIPEEHIQCAARIARHQVGGPALVDDVTAVGRHRGTRTISTTTTCATWRPAPPPWTPPASAAPASA